MKGLTDAELGREEAFSSVAEEARRARESKAELLKALKALLGAREGVAGYRQAFLDAQAAIARAEEK